MHNEITSNFCDSEISKRLREINFSDKCLGYYDSDGEFNYFTEEFINSPLWRYPWYLSKKNSIAPLRQQIIDWFRVEHSIYIAVLPFREGADNIELSWYYSVVEDDEELSDILCNEVDLGATDRLFDTYEEALTGAINNGIDLVKHRQHKVCQEV